MDIYQKILNYKKDKKLNNKDLGRLVLMSGDTFRKALSRKSLSELEIGQQAIFKHCQINEIVLPAEITKTNKERVVPINYHLLQIYKSMDFDNLPIDFYLFGSFRKSGKGNVGSKIDFILGLQKRNLL